MSFADPLIWKWDGGDESYPKIYSSEPGASVYKKTFTDLSSHTVRIKQTASKTRKRAEIRDTVQNPAVDGVLPPSTSIYFVVDMPADGSFESADLINMFDSFYQTMVASSSANLTKLWNGEI
jgi:hypothetical protein